MALLKHFLKIPVEDIIKNVDERIAMAVKCGIYGAQSRGSSVEVDEWIEYNVLGSWMGDGTPGFLMDE